ncbi:hypothetical protein GCM10017559_19530 [Streptosporangium longisporum]|uniref:MFS transporter n=2 Tax=Streptosporangium longisporum TaxID=46187 RepID=A0ABN3XWM9_9ACTN
MDALSFLLAALILLRLPAVPATPAAPAGEPALAVLRDRPYALISFLNMIALLNMPILSLVIPLWVVQRTQAPSWTVSALLVVNTLAVVLFQVRVARRVTDLGSASASVRLAGAVMFAACVVFALSSAVSGAWAAGLVLLLGACLQVAGEMLQASGAWEIGFDLAPAGRQGQYQGFFGSGAAVARMLGPLLLTTLIVVWGTPGWLVMGGVFLVSGLATGPAVHWARRTRPDPADSTDPTGPAGPVDPEGARTS